MIVKRDIDIKDFEFWGGAKYTVELLTDDELYMIEDVLTDCYPDGIDETTLNDIMWFEDEFIEEIIDRKLYED